LRLSVVAIAAGLTGCGHNDATSTVTTVPLTYSIGGTVAGLAGTLVLRNNGTDQVSLTNNGSFSFSVPLQPNASYDVTVATQPATQVCSVSNGSGTATANVLTVAVVCSVSSTATDVWTWAGGADYVNASTTANVPGARRQPVSWTDSSGNFWLFGGDSVGNVGTLDDLWEYQPTAGSWTSQGGATGTGAIASYGAQGTAAAGNNPGAREGAAAWADATGNLWLFGGDNVSGQTWQNFNDLWQYSPATGLWTWIGGSNVAGNAGTYGTQGVASAGNLPPARTGAMTWVDAAGIFWLFGGTQLNTTGSFLAVFNDLWNYNPTTALWTWVAGPNTANAAGVYGTQGITSATSLPGARTAGSIWLDANGEVWLFGGLGLSQTGASQEYNDLWEYVPTSNLWTWMGGSNTPNAAGAYGTQRAGVAGNGPGARTAAVSWMDHAGNFWLFGGFGFAQIGNAGNLNDLWEYNFDAGVWTWISGSASTGVAGIYGAQGVAAIANTPGARTHAAGWVDGNDNFWLFGGFGFDSSSAQGDLNDLWTFSQSR
jgi:N-acetylneuraminic acid mutarotase